MAQTVISAKCVDQALTLIDAPIIAAGGVEEDKITFDFCVLWDGFAKKAVFRYNESSTVVVDIDDGGACIIPSEVIAHPGDIYFGVYGVNEEGVRRTSTVVKYNIAKGAMNLL